MATTSAPPLSKKDFQSDQEVRWCPGCGDYAILSAVQAVFPELGIPREQLVIVSGIGCSSRFPYYMNTYGFHTIHGRAPAVATGLKTSRPDLDVWVVTGDGDALSIGGNHLIHALRRNVGPQDPALQQPHLRPDQGAVLADQRDGEEDQVARPMGSVDYPFNPLSLALGAEATFVARSVDVFQAHLKDDAQARRRAPGHRVRRDLPELQHLQRRRLRGDATEQGTRERDDALPRARQAAGLRRRPRTRASASTRGR